VTPAQPAQRRPLSITIVGALFIIAGLVGLAYHAPELATEPPLESGFVLFVRFLAVLAGAFVLRGANWARWLMVAWLAYHVVLTVPHAVSSAVVHFILLASIAFLVFRRAASAYFRSAARRSR